MLCPSVCAFNKNNILCYARASLLKGHCCQGALDHLAAVVCRHYRMRGRSAALKPNLTLKHCCQGALDHLDAAVCRRYRMRGRSASAALDAALPGGAGAPDARCDVDLIGDAAVRGPWPPEYMKLVMLLARFCEKDARCEVDLICDADSARALAL